MGLQVPISLDTLRKGFSVAEDRLIGSENRAITGSITREDSPVKYEDSLNNLFASVMSSEFPECQVKRELNKVDISICHDGFVIGVIESKGMVANSLSKDIIRDSLDLHGVRTKLNRDKRSKNSVEDDIVNIKDKLSTDTGWHWEIFVPIIYELYRDGAENEWQNKQKPWVTLPIYKNRRKTLKEDLTRWFQHNYHEQFTIIYATDAIALHDANEFWLEQSKKYSRFKSLDAYVSFFAFGRLVCGVNSQ